jgi:hypothetical protein
MSSWASPSNVVSDDVTSDIEASTTVSAVLSVVVVAGEAEAQAPNNSIARTKIDKIVSVFFIFFSFGMEDLRK